MTANELVKMFADRKSLEFGSTSGSAWAQCFGTKASSFWITKKQADWLIGVYMQENNIPSHNRHDGLGGSLADTIEYNGQQTFWMAYIAQNGCIQLALAQGKSEI